MNYSQLQNRLRQVKEEIYDLTNTQVTDVQAKIEILKDINERLKEQNKLLAIRQSFLNKCETKEYSLPTTTNSIGSNNLYFRAG